MSWRNNVWWTAGTHLTLAIDIGGTGLKASVVDEAAQLLTERVRVPTPVGAPPQQIVKVLVGMVAPLGAFDRISVGFPGVVRDGRVLTAPNLGNDQWQGFDARPALDSALWQAGARRQRRRPAGTGRDRRQGRRDGHNVGHGLRYGALSRRAAGAAPGDCPPPLPPWRDLRPAARQRHPQGDRQRALEQARQEGDRQPAPAHQLRSPLIGGGNAKKIDFALDPDVTVISNEAGMEGGVALWRY